MTQPSRAEYGSDVVVDLMRAAGIEYISFNPGATFRGLHDSLVNYGGNRHPETILCCHEEIAVSLAHGYAKAKGRPMATALHNVVGLQHGSMAIFNAFCDRAPILCLGGTGPMDTTKRRPWIDWVHTALVQGNQIRDYVKWDDQPASVGSIPEAFIRAWRTALTEPQGPVYLCLDAELQEQKLGHPVPIPDLSRFAPPAPPQADPRALEEAARQLVEAETPLLLAESLGRTPQARAALQRLAELLAAPVVDLADGHGGRSSMPGRHPLHLSDARQELVREADLLLALDVQNLLGPLGQLDSTTREVRLINPKVRIIAISLNEYAQRSWAHTGQALVPVDLPIAADAALALPVLVDLVADRLKKDPRAAARQDRAGRFRARHQALQDEWRKVAEQKRADRPVALPVLVSEIWESIKDEEWILANGHVNGWARRLWDWMPERTCGGSGGAGLGYGLGASLGVALAHRGSGKVCVNLQSEGDFLMVTSGLFTAAHHKIPLLIIMCDNRSYYNDEEHQARMAVARGRPVERKTIGIRIDNPPPDYAKIAQGFGIYGEGPIDEPGALQPALKRALRVVKEEGLPALVDVLIQPR